VRPIRVTHCKPCLPTPDVPTCLFKPKTFVPSAAQISIQASKERIRVIKGRAGTGKTTLLALCMAEALCEKSYFDQVEILALTFTAEASEVLYARLLSMGVPAALLAEAVQICSFKDICAQVLKTLTHNQLNMASDAAFADACKASLERVCEPDYQERFKRSDYGAFFPGAYDQELECFVASMHKLKMAMLLEEDVDHDILVEACYRQNIPYHHVFWAMEYERLRCTHDTLFPRFRTDIDLIYDLARAVAGNEVDMSLELAHVRQLYLDEAHDQSLASFTIVAGLMKNTQLRFTCVGDEFQVIYEEDSASSEFMSEPRMRSHFALRYGAEPILPLDLAHSYRFGHTLAFRTNKLHPDIKLKGSVLNDGFDMKETAVQRIDYETSPADPQGFLNCAKQAVDLIESHPALKEKNKKIAVIVRAEYLSLGLERGLMDAGIPHAWVGAALRANRKTDMPCFPRRPEILLLRAFLSLFPGQLEKMQADTRTLAVKTLIGFFGYRFPPAITERDDTQAHLWRTCKEDPKGLSIFLLQPTGFAFGLNSPTQNALYQSVLAEINRIALASEQDSAAGFLKFLGKTLNLKAWLKHHFVRDDKIRRAQGALALFQQACEAEAYSIAQTNDWLARQESFADASRTKARVMLGTVDMVKGMEFDVVLAPFLSQGVFPETGADTQIELNRFYVMCTRAKTQLIVFAPKSVASSFVLKMFGEHSRDDALQLASTAFEQDLPQAALSKTYPVYLSVPKGQGDLVKPHGARWLPGMMSWAAVEGSNFSALAEFMPRKH